LKYTEQFLLTLILHLSVLEKEIHVKRLFLNIHQVHVIFYWI